MNLTNQYKDKLCLSCKLFPESQSHLLQCQNIMPTLELLSLPKFVTDESYIYIDVQQQLQIVKIYSQVFKIKHKIFDEETNLDFNDLFSLNLQDI